MSTVTISSREFNQDTARAKRAAQEGPVVITDRGRSAYVLMTFEDYRRLAGAERSLLDVVAQPGVSDFDFDPPRLDLRLRDLPTD